MEIRNNELNLKAIREVNMMVNESKILNDIYQLLLSVLIYIINILAGNVNPIQGRFNGFELNLIFSYNVKKYSRL